MHGRKHDCRETYLGSFSHRHKHRLPFHDPIPALSRHGVFVRRLDGWIVKTASWQGWTGRNARRIVKFHAWLRLKLLLEDHEGHGK